MRRNRTTILLTVCTLLAGVVTARPETEEAPAAEAVTRNVPIDSVVVTGTRYAADIRHLPMTVSVVGRPEIEQRQESSLLPLLTEQVPGLFVTSRGVM